jgi:predicted amidohydrolase
LDYAPGAALWDFDPAKALYCLLVENSLTIPGKEVDQLLAMAQRSGAYLVMGAHELLGGTLYNTMLLFDRNGRDFQVHRKLMPTYTERLVWGRGDGSTLSILETEYGRVGGLICWEHWMPLARAAMHAKHEVLHVAQWPSVKELHQIASRHYAFEGQCYVVAAGSILTKADVLEGVSSLELDSSQALELLESLPGSDDELLLDGGSAVIAPDANYVAGPAEGTACIVYATVNPERINEGHLVLDTQGHYSRPDVFDLRVDDRPQSSISFASEAP